MIKVASLTLIPSGAEMVTPHKWIAFFNFLSFLSLFSCLVICGLFCQPSGAEKAPLTSGQPF